MLASRGNDRRVGVLVRSGFGNGNGNDCRIWLTSDYAIDGHGQRGLRRGLKHPGAKG